MSELDSEQQKKILEHIKKKVKFLDKCPMCHKPATLELLDEMFEVRESTDDPKKITLGGKMIPVIVVVCKNCGYTMFFNAFATGAITRKPIKIDK